MESRRENTGDTNNEILKSKSTDRNTRRDIDDDENVNYSSDDKYLAMEQQGVTYTQDSPHVARTDSTTPGAEDGMSDVWDNDAEVSRNSDAFNQDDALLSDNIDLDEDQSQSISSDEDFDTNTLDETR
jgi:hypothetical protein